jgi:hypothetical protein
MRLIRRWRRESVLDLYNLVLAAVLVAAPWLFTLTNPAGTVDLRTSGVAVAAISLAAIVAYASWEEWVNLLLGLWLIVSPGSWALPIPVRCISASAWARRWRFWPCSNCG